MTAPIREVAIIGSGPAGLTAAIYTARANLNPLMIEGELVSNTDQPGGQLMLTTEVENFPGFPDGIMGPELMANMRSQAQRFDAEIVTKRVSKVDFSARPFSIWVDESDGEPFAQANAVIIATGAQALMLGLESERRLLGHGVSTCATCDGFFFRDQDICVVGGGDSALEEAIFLSRFARTVTLIHRRDQFRGSRIMQERALANEKISVRWNAEVIEVLGETGVEGVRLSDTTDGTISTLPVTGMFVAIGHRPNTSLFEGQLELHPNGYLKTEPGSSRTSIDGVFACGDVQDDVYRQAITAAGSGCAAALDAERWLEAQHG